MKAFNYVAAQGLEQVVTLLSQYGEKACALSGGTDLIVQLRQGRKQVELLVDIKAIPEVNELSYSPTQGLLIGAAVPCWRIGHDPAIVKNYPGLVDAVGLIGGVQIQNRASLGGNLCNASPAADSIPALIVHSAVCSISGPQGSREIPAESFCISPGQTVLQPGEFLVALRLPPPPPHSGASYLRFTPRTEMDIAVAGAASQVVLSPDGTIFVSARISLGGVAPTPLLALAAGEALAGQPVSRIAIDRAADLARQAARPISDMRGSRAQRSHLCTVLVRRTLESAIERTQDGSRGRTK